MCKTSGNNEHKKIKASYAQIVSSRISVNPYEKEPYFEIVYFDTEKGKNYCGFGSFSLEYVEKWLEEEFEPGYKNIDCEIDSLLFRIEAAEAERDEEREHRIDAEQHADSFLKDCENMEEEIKRLKNDLKNAENCINAIEDDLDRGNDNDLAREHIEDWRNEKGMTNFV